MDELAVKNMMKRRRKIIITLVSALILIVVGMFIQHEITEMLNRKKVTFQYLSGKLEDVGELTTQQITYSAERSVKKGSIPFITQKGFTMRYNATMKAGIRFEEMSIKIKKEQVIVKIPHAEVMSNHVDPTSIEFTDEKNAIFNWKNEEDVTEALKEAEADVQNNPTVDYEELLERADEHAEELIHKLLDDSVDGREVEVRFR